MKIKKLDQIVRSPEKCISLGIKIAQRIHKGDVIVLIGNLASGKTTFVKGILFGLNYKYDVTSPTYTLINEYIADKKVIHIDFYREKNFQRWIDIGINEYLDSDDNITIIEWGDLHPCLIPKDAIKINFKHIDINQRRIYIQK